VIAVVCGDRAPTPADLERVLAVLSMEAATELRHPDTRPCSRRVAAEVVRRCPAISVQPFPAQRRTDAGFCAGAHREQSRRMLEGAAVLLHLPGSPESVDTRHCLAEALALGITIIQLPPTP
jgi:hypothetical protein